MAPEPVIVHRVRGRVRLRIRGDVEDPAMVRDLALRLEALPAVSGVTVNERTRSIVLRHPDVPFRELVPGLQAIGLRTVDVRPATESRPAISPLLQGFSRVDRAIGTGSSGRVDLRTLTFIGFMLLALRQIMKGNVMAPAIPLLWNAMELAMRFSSNSGDADA